MSKTERKIIEFLEEKKTLFFLLAITVLPALFTGVVTYSCYLFHVDYDLVGLSVVYTVAYCIFSYLLIRELRLGNSPEEEENGKGNENQAA